MRTACRAVSLRSAHGPDTTGRTGLIAMAGVSSAPRARRARRRAHRRARNKAANVISSLDGQPAKKEKEGRRKQGLLRFESKMKMAGLNALLGFS